MWNYPGESRDCETDTALVLVRITLDQGVDEWGGSCDHAQVLVVQQVYDARRPLTAGNDLLRGAEQPQQTECGRLLHYVHCVTDNITQLQIRPLSRHRSLLGCWFEWSPQPGGQHKSEFRYDWIGEEDCENTLFYKLSTKQKQTHVILNEFIF